MADNPPAAWVRGSAEELPLEPAGERILSKGAFAELIGVSPARISQYISAGIIDQAALIGEGRYARIRVTVAAHQVASRRHVGQALGNGAMNRAAAIAIEDRPSTDSHALPLTGPPGTISEQILVERLEQERRRNRRESEAEARRLAGLCPAAEVKRAIQSAERQLTAIFVGMGPAIAAAICSKYNLNREEVLPVIRRMLTKAARSLQ